MKRRHKHRTGFCFCIWVDPKLVFLTITVGCKSLSACCYPRGSACLSLSQALGFAGLIFQTQYSLFGPVWTRGCPYFQGHKTDVYHTARGGIQGRGRNLPSLFCTPLPCGFAPSSLGPPSFPQIEISFLPIHRVPLGSSGYYVLVQNVLLPHFLPLWKIDALECHSMSDRLLLLLKSDHHCGRIIWRYNRQGQIAVAPWEVYRMVNRIRYREMRYDYVDHLTLYKLITSGEVRRFFRPS